jgi:hypothetical protein
MSADNLEEAENRDRVPYRLWHRQGYIETTPGRAIDKGFVVHRLGEIASDFKVFGCAYDRYYIAELLRLIAQEGVKIPMIKWGQSWKDIHLVRGSRPRIDRPAESDGLVAAVTACGLAARTPPKKPTVYASRPLLVLGA